MTLCIKERNEISKYELYHCETFVINLNHEKSTFDKKDTDMIKVITTTCITIQFFCWNQLL